MNIYNKEGNMSFITEIQCMIVLMYAVAEMIVLLLLFVFFGALKG